MSDRVAKMRAKQQAHCAPQDVKLAPMPLDEQEVAELPVVFECGHTRPLASLKKRKCPACVAEQHSTEMQARKRPVVRTSLEDRHGLPQGFRWPAGTKIIKEWDGECWAVTAVLPDGEFLVIMDKSSFGAESKAALEFVKRNVPGKEKQA